MYPNRSTALSTVDKSLWYFDQPAEDPQGTSYLCQTNGWSAVRDAQDAMGDMALNGLLDQVSTGPAVGHTPRTVPAIPAKIETGWTLPVLVRMQEMATHLGLLERDPHGMATLANEIRQNRTGQSLSSFTVRLALWLGNHSRATQTSPGGTENDAGFLYNVGSPSEITLPYDFLGPRLGDTFRNPLQQEQIFGVVCQPVTYWRQRNAATSSQVAFYGSLVLLVGLVGGSLAASRAF